jgi:hypothetical protein
MKTICLGENWRYDIFAIARRFTPWNEIVVE